MGLLDQVFGSVTGSQTGESSSVSPAVKALLLLFAAKAASHYLHGSSPQAGNPPPEAQQPGAADQQNTITSGILKGMPSLQGLGALVERFTQSGHGDTVQSWIGTGENQPISPDQMHNAIGTDTIDQLQQQTGMPRDQLLNELSRMLPQVVNQLTPQGRLPTQQEAT